MLLCLICAQDLCAQVGEEELFRQEFRLITLTNPIKGWMYASGEEQKSVKTISNSMPSSPYSFLSADGLLTFVQGGKDDGANASASRISAQIKLDVTVSQYLLVVQRAPQDSPFPYVILAIPGGISKVDLGNYIFFNLTKTPVAGSVDGVNFGVLPRERKELAMRSNSKNHAVSAKFARHEGGEWEVRYTNVWSYTPKARYLVLIVEDVNSSANGLSFKILKDYAQ